MRGVFGEIILSVLIGLKFHDEDMGDSILLRLLGSISCNATTSAEMTYMVTLRRILLSRFE